VGKAHARLAADAAAMPAFASFVFKFAFTYPPSF
jgi:hypothetical protein